MRTIVAVTQGLAAVRHRGGAPPLMWDVEMNAPPANLRKKGDPESHLILRSKYLIVSAAATISAAFLAFVVYHSWIDGGQWIVQITKEHFAAVIGLPFASMASFCIVMLLRFSEGEIEFEGLGFKFKGASGQVVLWALCFSVIAVAIKLLW